nr:MAG TPA: hypothetical protein [Caudoviricetes sp.]
MEYITSPTSGRSSRNTMQSTISIMRYRKNIIYGWKTKRE